jgi:hypothetical protein
MTTLDVLFRRIAGSAGAIGRPQVESFLKDAGVGDGLLGGAKVSLAADAFLDKFGKKQLTWESFVAQGRALLPGELQKSADRATVEREIDKLFSALDKDGRGISMDVLTAHLKALAEAKGQSMAGAKADVGAKILMHALDDNGDRRLQKDELKGFALDILRRVSDK